MKSIATPATFARHHVIPFKDDNEHFSFGNFPKTVLKNFPTKLMTFFRKFIKK